MPPPRRPSRPGHWSGRWGGVGALRGDDTGAAAVEFAIVLPVLLLIVFAIVDFGRAYNQRLLLNQAAREGARAEAVGLSAQTQVDNVMGGSGKATATVAVACPAGAATNVSAKVVVTATFTPATQISSIAGLFGKSIGWSSMSATGIMACVG
ncbi:TadE/TadG family type IV pilus assembly protein [Dactylosporangium matsuzakiense]|uniref:TadE/TadG family type IV pilus assembly protein n=1 Tax=Dactylosporangium matsuzakiense TaxID=53360 RepID=UPI0022F312FD|nr:TadE/TadG family type IV pilus assembly protein [Dactylosporangium matsuzakiense]